MQRLLCNIATAMPVDEGSDDALSSVTPAVWTDGTCKGWLHKFSLGRSWLGTSNWKRRYFVLASLGNAVGLGYYEDEKATNMIGSLRLDQQQTRLVTRPSTLTHKMATNLGCDFCIIFFDAAEKKDMCFLLRAESREEHDRWIGALGYHFKVVDQACDHVC